MSDLIDRQAAIDVIENEQKKIMRSDWAIDQAKFSAMSEIRELILGLPSVNPQPKIGWVPVSEKLPEDGTYLTCTDTGYIATIQYSCYMGWLLDSNIVAWMPLPPSYQGGTI